MSAFIIVDVKIKDPLSYERYKTMTPGSLAAYGGRFVVRGGPTQVLEGPWTPGRIVVLEFDSAERARAWWSSEEYREAKELRQSIADTKMILVDGL